MVQYHGPKENEREVQHHQTSIGLREDNENSKSWQGCGERSAGAGHNVDAALKDGKTGPHLMLLPLQHRSHGPCSE